MGWLRGQFVDIIKWEPKSPGQIVFHFERHNREIKKGAKLLVMPGEAAIFVNEGRLADVFDQSNTYTLDDAKNLPILSTLMGWKYCFESPTKADVFFVSLANFMGSKWGTRGKIDFNDPEFGPVAIGAYGSYDWSVKSPATFFEKLVASLTEYSTEKITDQIRTIISSAASTAIAKSKTPLMEMEANKDEFEKIILKVIAPQVAEYGLNITKFVIADVSFPPEIEEALAEVRKASAEVMRLKKMQGVMGTYQQMAAADAMREAAKNPGMGGAAMGLGVGFGMGNQMMNAMAPAMQPAIAPPPPAPATPFYIAVGGQQAGPYTPQQLQQYAGTGQVTKDTMVWKQGMAQWSPASQVAELGSLFAPAGPPPLPPGSVPPPPPSV